MTTLSKADQDLEMDANAVRREEREDDARERKGYKKGGSVKKYAKGGAVRGGGCESKGKTRGKFV